MPTPYLDRVEQQNALLDEWAAVRREINQAEARAAALLAQRALLMDEDADEQPMHREAIWRSMIAEHSAAGHIAKGTAERAFSEARWLATDDYAPLRDSYEAGNIAPAHVREIMTASFSIHDAINAGSATPDTLNLYQVAAVVFAETEAPSRTRAHVREIAAALAGLTINENHQRAREERNVSVRSVGDGMALLQILLPEHLAVAIMDRLTQMARHQKQHPDDREPTLPINEDAVEEMLHGDPYYYDSAHDAERTANNSADSDHGHNGASDDNTGNAVRDETIFGKDDTFTRDPFDGEDTYDNGEWVPPDEDRFRNDPDAYWEHVEKMITAGPHVIQIPSDARTTDQVRTDLLTDLLLTADPSEIHGTGLSNITAMIQITVAASTLSGADDHPAQLDGHGELHPDVARDLAGANTGWTRLFLDPTGIVTETDTYTPTAAMKRFLRARDQHCRFPGCRMPTHRCEVDHNHDHAKGGRTATRNLCHLCKTHHALKHPDIPDRYRWTAHQQPNWDTIWTSPNGRTYTDAPRRRVMFVPTPLAHAGTDSNTWRTPTASNTPMSDAPF